MEPKNRPRQNGIQIKSVMFYRMGTLIFLVDQAAVGVGTAR
jgi:hypothetical protein